MHRAIFFGVLAQAAFAQLAVTDLGGTQTQHVFKLNGYAGPVTISVSESNTYSPLIPDVDGTQYAGAGTDTGRTDTITWADGSHIVTIGHQQGNRALGEETTYYWRFTDGTTTLTGSFLTPTVAKTTQSYPVPFKSGNWGQRNLPVVSPADLLNKNKIVDPVSGVKLHLASNALDWTFRNPGGGNPSPVAGTLSFPYYDQAAGWTNPQDVVNGLTSDASTGNTNPIDIYPGNEFHQNFAPYFWWSLNDIGVSLFATGTDATQGNRDFTICIFTNPVDGCLGTPITVHPSTGAIAHIASASSDPDQPFPSSFPQAFFTGWGTGVFIPMNSRPSQGTVNVTGGVATLTALPTSGNNFNLTLKAGSKIRIAGSSPTCTNNLCTVSTLDSAVQVHLVENLTISGAQYTSLPFGFRIQKSTATGTLTVGAAYKYAGSINVNNQGGAENARCGANTFATGDVPAKQAHICTVTTSVTGIDFWYFLMTDGTSRPFFQGTIPQSSYFTGTLGWSINDAPNFLALCCGIAQVAPAADARTWYVYGRNQAGGNNLWTMHYDGDTTENRDWAYTLAIGSDGYQQYSPSNKTTWAKVIDNTNTIVSQIAANFPSYNASLYGSSWSLIGVSGTTAYFENNYNNTQNLGAWIAVVDISSGTGTVTNVIHSLDGTGLGGNMRFGGVHNAAALPEVPNSFQATNNILAANDTTKLHGGPFEFPITHVLRGGVFSTNTALPWPIDNTYDNSCPTNPYSAQGATGNQCFTFAFPAGGWCNLAPSATEKATWPCPTPGSAIAGWTPANYAQPFPIRIGDMFVDGSTGSGAPGDNENFRVVQITVGTGPNGESVGVAQRNAMPDYCCVAPGPIVGSTCVDSGAQNVHLTTWVALATATRFNGCNSGVYNVTGLNSSATIAEVGRSLQGHGDFSAGTIANDFTYFSSSGATPQAPLASVLAPPVSINAFVSPTFQGSALPIGGGSIQSYSVSPGGVPWFTDTNTVNNGFGVGREIVQGTIPAARDLTATGTANVYTIEVLGTVDVKRQNPIGWAGENNLLDISGPGSNIASQPYGLCIPRANNECLAGSVAGATGSHTLTLAYINVPHMYDPGDGFCRIGLHWANVPCVISGWNGAGGFRQQGWTVADPSSTQSRFLTYLNDIPGGQYAYSTFEPMDSSSAWGPATIASGWGPVTWNVTLPTWYAGAGTSNALGSFPLTFGAGFNFRKVKFGYSRYMGPDKAVSAANLQCISRGDPCNTNGSPYSFESESSSGTACGSGCTINIPITTPNVMYYTACTSPDNSSWTCGGDMQVAVQAAVGPCTDLTYSPTSASVDQNSHTGTITLTVTNQVCSSINTSGSAYLTITGAAGGCSVTAGVANCTGNGTFNYALAANTAPARSGTITPDSGTSTFTISQASGCTFSIAPGSHAFPGGGGTFGVTITASDTSCPWTATYPDAWLSGPNFGTGSGSITLTAAANSGAPRSSSPTIATQSFSATQPSSAGTGVGISTTPGIRLTPGVRLQ